MENKVEKAIDDFVETPQTEEEKAKAIAEVIAKEKRDNLKKVVLDEREGLIERIDRVLVTKDGKQLLREWY
jgi:ABC-type protease/lipase transport system fused ATPase/permease subunit